MVSDAREGAKISCTIPAGLMKMGERFRSHICGMLDPLTAPTWQSMPAHRSLRLITAQRFELNVEKRKRFVAPHRPFQVQVNPIKSRWLEEGRFYLKSRRD